MIRLEHTEHRKGNTKEREQSKKKENQKGENKKKKKRWLSPTAVNNYLKCPRSFFLSKIEKLKQKPSIHLIRGIAVHSAAEKFYKNKMNKYPEMDYSDLRNIVLGLFKTEWEYKKNQLDRLDLNPDEIEFFYSDSQKMMINFLDDFIQNKGFEKPTPIVEKMLFSHKYLLLAKLDKIEMNRNDSREIPDYIEDFKTSKSMEITESIKRQLGICSILYEEIYKRKPVLGINFLKFRKGKKIVEISEEYKEELKNLILDIHSKTQSEDIDDYPCTCGWCKKNFDTDTLCQRLI